LGPDAAPAVPELNRLVPHTNSVRPSLRARIALACIGTGGFLRFEVALANQAGPTQLRGNAIFGIELVGTNVPAAALAALVGPLEDPAYLVRVMTTNALSKIEVLHNGGGADEWEFRTRKLKTGRWVSLGEGFAGGGHLHLAGVLMREDWGFAGAGTLC